MDRFLEKLFAFIRKNALIFYAGIGMGIYRCAHEWPLWFNATVTQVGVPPLFVGESFFLLVDVGKVVGLIVYLILCYGFDKHRRSSVLLILPSALIVVGCLVPLGVVLGLDPGETAILASLVLIGAGAGMLFGQWIEFCGCLPPVKVIQVFAISFAARFVLLPIITGVDELLSTLVIICLAATSFVQVSFCFSAIPIAEDRPREGLGAKGLSGYGMLFLFVCVFAFAYGVGGSATQLSHSTHETGVGNLLPSLVILILAFKMGDRFDRTILYAIALPLMTVGLIGVEFLGISLSFSQVMVSAAYSAFDLLVYTMVCSNAYRSRTSAMLPGSCIRILALIAADLAILLMHLNLSWNRGVLVTVTILATLAAGIAVFVPLLGSQRDYSRFQPEGESAERKRLEDIAASRGLSARETTVFHLLVKGKSATEISEELFISNGAVRAHSSRIYDKFGVHSRKDFDALFDR
ncbi:helix-turn-helix transcriptional regulator [Raoultibacter phocaeensis]|uniref:helix-turn-helix transcriptional regulator n=1 Tax=Raoultibacter phocaeensis TaxID=2479841 RepID=UPI00111A3456|nr:helix-turn-helix transcriptional regulator [Raoultibacter phocaeensis]